MISAILLAAGQSKRMNGENKLNKIINNQPLIKHSINNILKSNIDELIIVVGYQEEIIKKLKDESNKIMIRPETTGKPTQWGDIPEIVNRNNNYKQYC